MPGASEPLSTRCRDAVERLTGGFDRSADRLLVALSGGPDSVALLHLLQNLWPGRIAAATVDHGLRPESADEARACARWCTGLGVAHRVLAPEQPITGSVQAEARAARYALLEQAREDLGCRWIATAHHADDQLETLLMRLARGAGLDGLSGVRERAGAIIRPLLDCRKAELLDYCAEQALPFVRDPSNERLEFDRVRMREALSRFDTIDPLAAVRSARALAESGAALDWVAQREAATVIMVEADRIILARTDYPHELLRRLTLIALRHVQPAIEPRGPALDAFLERLQRGERAMLGECLGDGGARWTFRRAPPRQTG